MADETSFSTSNQSQYFASKPADKTAQILEAKIDEWSNSLTSNGFQEKLRSMYLAYHGAYYSDAGNGHQVTFSGEQGELVNLPVNHFRNIAQHILNMVCSNRPAMECRATNTDYKSLVQTTLANSILEYYMREKRLEVYLKRAAEYSIVYGSGFIKMEWDDTRGEVVDYDEETKTQIHEGDILFENLSPFDVVFDGTKENDNHDWVLIRSWKNKFDLAAKYPELAEKLIGLQTKSDLNKWKLGLTNLTDTTDDVQVIEFYHKRTESMPDGRYMMFCTSETILQDLPMPYRVLPVFRIAPSNIHGTPHGYTPMFDLLPLQEGVNSLYSTILTNQNAFGVQNVLNPRGTDIAVNQLVGGLNVIDYNAQAGTPTALNLTNTPKEVFEFLQMLEHTMETLSGVNSVARGNPEASLKSGTALALVQSMALQFMSGLQQSYVELIESVGSGIIKLLQDFAHTPRLVAIAGKTNRTFMKEFSGQDISNISRVVVDIGNPLSHTTAGRVQMAQELIQYGEITPSQYLSIINTGNLDSLTEEVEHENLLMRAENEAMMDGEEPPVTDIDSHEQHIKYHKGLLADPDLRKDESLVTRCLGHIQKHIESLRSVDPALLGLLGQHALPPSPPPQQPGGPPPGSPPPPGGAPQPHPGAPPSGPSGQMMPTMEGQMGPGVVGGKIVGPGMEQGQRLPKPSQVPASMLVNPAIQEQNLNNVNMKK